MFTPIDQKSKLNDIEYINIMLQSLLHMYWVFELNDSLKFLEQNNT